MVEEYLDNKVEEKKEVANKLIQKDPVYSVQKQNRKKKRYQKGLYTTVTETIPGNENTKSYEKLEKFTSQKSCSANPRYPG